MKIAIACLAAAACAAEEPPPALPTLPPAVELGERVYAATLVGDQPVWVERDDDGVHLHLHVGDAVVDEGGLAPDEGGPIIVAGPDALLWGLSGSFFCGPLRAVPAGGGAPFTLVDSPCPGAFDEIGGGLTLLRQDEHGEYGLDRYPLAGGATVRTLALPGLRPRDAARIGNWLLLSADTGDGTAAFVTATPRADPTHADVRFGGAARWPLVGTGDDVYWIEGDTVHTQSLAPGAAPPHPVAAAAPFRAWTATPAALWLGGDGTLQRIDVATGDSELYAVPYTVSAILARDDALFVTTYTDARSIPVLVRQPLAPAP